MPPASRCSICKQIAHDVHRECSPRGKMHTPPYGVSRIGDPSAPFRRPSLCTRGAGCICAASRSDVHYPDDICHGVTYARDTPRCPPSAEELRSYAPSGASLRWRARQSHLADATHRRCICDDIVPAERRDLRLRRICTARSAATYMQHHGVMCISRSLGSASAGCPRCKLPPSVSGHSDRRSYVLRRSAPQLALPQS